MSWTLIAETVLGAPAATVTFAAIPGTYRHLALLAQLQTTLGAGASDRVWWRANADAGPNYGYMWVYTTGAGGWAFGANIAQTQSESLVGEAINIAPNNFAPNFCIWEGYARADRTKMIRQTTMTLQDYNITGDIATWDTAGYWSSLAAITDLTFGPVAAATFSAGCIFTLYGVT